MAACDINVFYKPTATHINFEYNTMLQISMTISCTVYHKYFIWKLDLYIHKNKYNMAAAAPKNRLIRQVLWL